MYFIPFVFHLQILLTFHRNTTLEVSNKLRKYTFSICHYCELLAPEASKMNVYAVHWRGGTRRD